ncbi:hypothetical protein Taro_017468 [Colocasia esculenta]|uniref:Uncharacterized protein n=1 Tax=Colocasia esculenta TaxID=4460 RepID=A0A843UZG5_COLES|nr:hypothetical protein [Colocasia esculenta]
MAPVSVTAGFLLGVLVLSVVLRHSVADARPAAEIAEFSSNVDGVFLEGSLGHQDDPRALTATTTAVKSKMLRGRKMASEESGNVVKKREGMKVKGEWKNVAGTRTFAASCADREGEGELDVECELSGRGQPSGVNFVDFIPFSSDYRGAKTHPPKNN